MLDIELPDKCSKYKVSCGTIPCSGQGRVGNCTNYYFWASHACKLLAKFWILDAIVWICMFVLGSFIPVIALLRAAPKPA